MNAFVFKKEYFSPGFWKATFWGSPTRKRLSGNFFSLSILQIVNYVLPFITLPYLFRVLGTEKFGLIAFSQSIAELFMVVIDFGFSLSATKEISINRDNKKKLSRIFSSVMATELFLAFVCLLVLGVIILIFPRFRADWPVYLFSLVAVIGSLMVSVWFFQGIERMKYITILNIGAKIVFTLSIFFFVKNQSDYLYVPLSNCLGYFSASLLSFLIMRHTMGINFNQVGFHDIFLRLNEGWYFFVPLMANSLRSSSGTFVLGLLTNNTMAGFYSIAEKVMRALEVILSPLFQSIYPFFAKIYKDERKRALVIFKKTVLLSMAMSLTLAVVAFVFAPLVVGLLANHPVSESVLALRILAVSVFFYGINIILGYQGLIVAGLQKELLKVMAFCGILNYILLFSLIPMYGISGAALSVVVSEILITITEFTVLRKKRII